MRRLRVLLDANVIVDAQVRDLFCRLAEADLIELRWSAQILEETRRTLIDELRLDPSKVDRLINALTRAFADASVTAYDELVDRLELPDPDDRHVLAAAAHGECDLLITENVKDFPEAAVEQLDVLVLSVDDSLVLLAGSFQARLGEVVDRQIAALRRPQMSREVFLERLASRAPMGAVAIGAALGIETYQRILGDVLDAESDQSPQGAVRRLLLAVEVGDSEQLARLVDPVLAKRITGFSTPTPSELCATLQVALEDVSTSEGWGFATAKRVHGPDTELVKLIRAGHDPLVVFGPQEAEGHLFHLRLQDDDWVLVDLDGPDPAITDNPASSRE